MHNHCDYAKIRKIKQINEALASSEAFVTLGQSKRLVNIAEYQNGGPIEDEDLLEEKNWHLSINKYYTHITCYTTKYVGSYSASIDYYIEDFYDYDKTKTQDLYGTTISPQEMWELHYAGLAKAFTISEKDSFNATWSQGQRYLSDALIDDKLYD